MSRHVRRSVRTLAVAAGMLALTTSCLPGASSEGGDEAETIGAGESPAEEWTGTITMFAQEYTPNAEVANSYGLTALQDAADGFAEEHPGVTVEFVDEKFDVYTEQVRVKAAAGELWDVYWGQWAALNGSLPEGIAYDLAPAFEEPNPYAPEYDTWAEAMNPQVIEATRAGSGASYNINGDFVTTGWYYNADLFEQAGITEPPATWGEFVELCTTLRDAGITPVAFVPYYGHMQRHWLSDLYSDDFEAITQLDGAPGFSGADEALAIGEGILSPADPRFLAWWPTFKQATDTWQPDYITAPAERNDRAKQDFFAGDAAMYYSGSQTARELASAEVPFTWASFPFPTITPEDNEFASGDDTASAVGGPTGAYQYAISTAQANSTMEEPGKAEVVLDWLRYIGTPETAQSVVNETGQFLPSFTDTEPVEDLAEFADIVNQPWQSLYVGFSAPNLDTDLQRIFGNYLGGNITIEQARDELTPLLETAAADFRAQNGLE